MGDLPLRRAKTNDIWRRLFKKNNRPIDSIEIEFQDIPELGSGSIKARYPLNLICGENGAGKTAILALLYRALKHEHPHHLLDHVTQFGGRAQAGTVLKIEITTKLENSAETTVINTVEQLRTHLKHEKDDGFLYFIDPAESTAWITNLIRSDSNFRDLTEGISPLTLNPSDLAIVSALIGKNYNNLLIFEIDSIDGHPPFPYFEATYGSNMYDTLAMGKGEACLLYLFWAIKRLPRKSIALIEEPDAFTAIRSHRSIADFLAVASFENDHFFIISSHSGALAERFPNEALQLCSRTATGISIQVNPSASELISRLGMSLRNRIICVVEDEAAGSFLTSLLEHVDSRLSSCTELVLASGNGGISTCLKTLTRKLGCKLSIIGIWDADLSIEAEDSGEWAKLKLPGTMPPEREILGIVHNKQVSELSDLTGLSSDALHSAISAAEGLDHHDQLNKIAEQLKLGTNQLIDLIIPTWIQYNQEITRRFIDDFKKVIATK